MTLRKVMTSAQNTPAPGESRNRRRRGGRGRGTGPRPAAQQPQTRPAEAVPAPAAVPAGDAPPVLPPDTPSAALGVPAPLVEVLAASGIPAPFPIQVATLP